MFFVPKNYFRTILLTIAMFILAITGSNAQSWFSEVSQGGFILKKVVSDTTIQSGQSFSYTIYYTIPAGATNITITDNISPSLIFLGSSVNLACGTPTITAPVVNAMGGAFSVSWASVPAGCVGSFTVTVAFPNGVTCPGTSVRNNACIQATLGSKVYEFCTGFVNTTAQATNPWGIYKYPLGTAWIGGNCPYATGNDTITYQICVYKSVGTTGQLNLVNAIVRDTLPTGAVLVSSSCGATQSGNVITWNIGNLSALPAYNSTCCNFVVYYPLALFPNGSSISNSVTLSGSLGPVQPVCSNFNTSASTCVKKVVVQSGSISKWVYTNRQPGCAGQYVIYICNNGTTALPVTAKDTLPTALSGYSIASVWPATVTATITSGIVSISGTLGIGQCCAVYINFTIPLAAPVGSTITNCVYLTSVTPVVSYCNSFVVDSVTPKACLWKEVCQKQTSYTPGSIFRYRLRVQNIGGAALTGTTITDILNPNLQYVGNPSYYTLNTWSVPNCKTAPTPTEQWSGVSLSYNSGLNTVTATLPSIPAICQSVFYPSCGMYGTGGIPYYYIEFDVKVRDTAAMGNIPNKFSLSGGTLGANIETSNIEYVLVTGVVGFTLQKQVKKPADVTYSNSATVIPGSLVNYKLKMNSSGTAALGHITFVDLLPRDVSPSDQLILPPCSPRNSQFDIYWNSVLGTPNPNPVFPYNNPTVSLSRVNNLLPVGAPGNSFATSCGTNGTWSSGLTPNMKNFGIYFGSTAVGLTGAEYQFVAKIDSAAKASQTACNTFASSGWTKHLIQSNLLSYINAGELESVPVCVTIDSVQHPTGCLKNVKVDVVCKGKDAAGNAIYTITLSATSCAPAVLMVTSPHGTISPSTYNLVSSPWSISMNFVYTSAANPITLNYTLSCNGELCRDSIRRDLPPCNGTPPPPGDCCVDFKHIFKDPKIVWNSATGYVGLSVPVIAGPAPIKKFSATIVSAQLRTICPFPSAWYRIFGDITGGSVVVAPGTGPQLLSLYSREAIWGQDSCVDWNNSASINLNMLFPPFSGAKFCTDNLVFSIRYSFTDCKCNTCDTVVRYSISRKKAIIIWNPIPYDNFGLGIIKQSIEEKDNDGNVILAANPTETSLVMKDNTSGTFWIISPKDTANNIIVNGLELSSNEVDFESITNSGNNGIIQDNVAFIPLSVKPGDQSPTEIKFINSSKLNKFSVYARFLYSMDGSDEQIFSEPVPYIALVPGVASDILGVDKATKPTGVGTYAVYLHNQNGYKDTLSAISLNVAKDYKILAVGPPQVNASGVVVFPRKDVNGSYIIGLNADGAMVNPEDKVIPIYLTISGIVNKPPQVDFNTYDEFGNIVSTGILQLSDPIAKVNDETDPLDGSTMMSVYPNPASNIATLTINNLKTINNAKIIIQDLSGRNIATITDNSLLQEGSHIFNVNLSNVTSGTYFVVCTDGVNSSTYKFVVNK